MKLFNFKHYFDTLTVQIFAFFWLACLIVLAVIFTVPALTTAQPNKIQSGLSVYPVQTQNFIQNGLKSLFNYGKKDAVPNIPKLLPLSDDGQTITSYLNNDEILGTYIYAVEQPAELINPSIANNKLFGPFSLGTLINKQNRILYFMNVVLPQQNIIDIAADFPLIFMIILLVSTPILLWLAWTITKPVRALRTSVNDVAVGNFIANPELEKIGALEFREAGRSFNQMIKSLDEFNESKQRLLSDISHELRSPLTRLQLTFGLIRRRHQTAIPELARLETEAERLDEMINDLLLWSRQPFNSHAPKEILPINVIWERVFEDAIFESEQRQLQLFIDNMIPVTKEYFIHANFTLLSSALENIIMNAQKYANNKIEICLYIEGDFLYITVGDDGIGVPDYEYENIFVPFYRVHDNRVNIAGTGLGLAIVANAIMQHKGKIKADQSPLGGLRIEIMLPLFQGSVIVTNHLI